jgi:hypothetical protein
MKHTSPFLMTAPVVEDMERVYSSQQPLSLTLSLSLSLSLSLYIYIYICICICMYMPIDTVRKQTKNNGAVLHGQRTHPRSDAKRRAFVCWHS